MCRNLMRNNSSQGWLPTFIVNQISSYQPLRIDRIRKLIISSSTAKSKSKHLHPPSYKRQFLRRSISPFSEDNEDTSSTTSSSSLEENWVDPTEEEYATSLIQTSNQLDQYNLQMRISRIESDVSKCLSLLESNKTDSETLWIKSATPIPEINLPPKRSKQGKVLFFCLVVLWPIISYFLYLRFRKNFQLILVKLVHKIFFRIK
jgi:hypothetical protein